MRKILLLMIIVLLSGCNDSNGGPNQEVNRNDGSSVVTTTATTTTTTTVTLTNNISDINDYTDSKGNGEIATDELNNFTYNKHDKPIVNNAPYYKVIDATRVDLVKGVLYVDKYFDTDYEALNSILQKEPLAALDVEDGNIAIQYLYDVNAKSYTLLAEDSDGNIAQLTLPTLIKDENQVQDDTYPNKKPDGSVDYNDGYNNGYKEGYEEGYNGKEYDPSEQYGNDDYLEGFKNGYQDGYAQGTKDREQKEKDNQANQEDTSGSEYERNEGSREGLTDTAVKYEVPENHGAAQLNNAGYQYELPIVWRDVVNQSDEKFFTPTTKWKGQISYGNMADGKTKEHYATVTYNSPKEFAFDLDKVPHTVESTNYKDVSNVTYSNGVLTYTEIRYDNGNNPYVYNYTVNYNTKITTVTVYIDANQTLYYYYYDASTRMLEVIMSRKAYAESGSQMTIVNMVTNEYWAFHATTQTEGYNEIVGGIDLVMEEAFAIPGAIIRE
ncbi:MAG: Yae1 family protein [Erysipelotrichales bacterium]|nr:Yae1 family protein [Erysipelotrichales bacterium]